MLYLHDPASLALLKSWPWFQKKIYLQKLIYKKTLTCESWFVNLVF